MGFHHVRPIIGVTWTCQSCEDDFYGIELLGFGKPKAWLFPYEMLTINSPKEAQYGKEVVDDKIKSVFVDEKAQKAGVLGIEQRFRKMSKLAKNDTWKIIHKTKDLTSLIEKWNKEERRWDWVKGERLFSYPQ